MIGLIENNIQKRKIYLAIYFLVFTFFLLVKGYKTEITVDEAFSFLNYSYTKDYLNIGIANNHILNSILVGIISPLGISELFLRIPNLIFGIIYLILILFFSSKKDNYIICSLILILNPYLFDYFAISRGYGIGSSLIFLSCYLYLFSKRNNVIAPLILLSIATFSYHVIVVFLFSFWLVNIINLKNNYKITHFIFINSIVLSVSLINLYLLLNVTAEGKPLYGVSNLSIFDILTGSFGLNSLYINNELPFNIFLNLLFLSPLIFFRLLSNKEKNVVAFSYLTLFLIYLIPYILNKPFPLLRAVVCFLPPILLLVCQVIEKLIKKTENINIVGLITVSMFFFLFSFINSIKINKTIDWQDGMKRSEILQRDDDCGFVIPFNELDSVGQYYRLIDELNYEKESSIC